MQYHEIQKRRLSSSGDKTPPSTPCSTPSNSPLTFSTPTTKSVGGVRQNEQYKKFLRRQMVLLKSVEDSRTLAQWRRLATPTIEASTLSKVPGVKIKGGSPPVFCSRKETADVITNNTDVNDIHNDDAVNDNYSTSAKKRLAFNYNTTAVYSTIGSPVYRPLGLAELFGPKIVRRSLRPGTLLKKPSIQRDTDSSKIGLGMLVTAGDKTKGIVDVGFNDDDGNCSKSRGVVQRCCNE